MCVGWNRKASPWWRFTSDVRCEGRARCGGWGDKRRAAREAGGSKEGQCRWGACERKTWGVGGAGGVGSVALAPGRLSAGACRTRGARVAARVFLHVVKLLRVRLPVIVLLLFVVDEVRVVGIHRVIAVAIIGIQLAVRAVVLGLVRYDTAQNLWEWNSSTTRCQSSPESWPVQRKNSPACFRVCVLCVVEWALSGSVKFKATCKALTMVLG